MANKAKTRVATTAQSSGQTVAKTSAAQPQSTTTNSTAAAEKAKPAAPRIFTDAERALLKSKEDIIGSNQSAFLGLGEALHAIKEGGLYEISHPGLTFEDYCAKRWGFGQAYAYRLIAAYLCVKNLKDSLTPNKVTVFPVNESQVRPKAGLKPDEQVKVWTAVLEKANGQTVTASRQSNFINALCQFLDVATVCFALIRRPILGSAERQLVGL